MNIIILVIFFFIFTTIDSVNRYCAENPTCHCASVNDHVARFSCYVNDKTKFIVTIIAGDSVQIVCKNWEGWESFNVKTNLSGKKINTVDFQNCGISNKIRLKDVVEKLGVETIYSLIFNSFKSYYGTLKNEDFQGFHNVTKIDLSYNGLTNISSLFLEERNKIEWMNLSHNALILPHRFFFLNPFIKGIDLSNNEIKWLFGGLFYKLNELKYLDLNNNLLEEFVVGTFEDLVSLKFLNISNNKLIALKERAFYELHKLEILDMSFNKFTSLPLRLLEKTTQLRELYLHNNRRMMGTLPDYFFADLPKLEIVYLNNNKFTFLPSELFLDSVALKYINFDDNYLTTLPYNIFRGQENAVELSIRNNMIETLPDKIFRDMINLEKLDLSGNEITFLTSDLFDGLIFLTELNMENNQISYIEETALSRMLVLKIAKFSRNKLTLQSNNNWYSLRHNLFLEEFHLSHNDIKYLIIDWTKYGHYLRLVDLSHNQIGKLCTTELMYPSFKFVIDLTFNKIANIFFNDEEKLEKYFSKNYNIVVLMDNNPILCDCQLYDLLRFRENRLPNFYSHYINFTLGNLSCINPDEIEGPIIKYQDSTTYTCPEDKYFKISKNCQTGCNCKVRLYDNTRILDCSYRKMSKFLIDPTKVKPVEGYSLIVNLTENVLTEIPSVRVLEPMNVTELLLSNNRISQMTTDGLPKTLKVLELHNNDISEFKLNEFGYVYSGVLNEFTLRGNPFKCDCSIKELVYLIKRKRFSYRDLENLECNGLPMYKITEDMLNCPSYHGLTVLSYIIKIFVPLIIFLVLIPWIHKRIYGISLRDRLGGILRRRLFPWHDLLF